jgi:hypothetical protein
MALEISAWAVSDIQQMQVAANALGQQIIVLNAGTDSELLATLRRFPNIRFERSSSEAILSSTVGRNNLSLWPLTCPCSKSPQG